MKRSEIREHIFKILFGTEFNKNDEMPEQLEHYCAEMEGAEEKEIAYIKDKVGRIAERTEEIDSLINSHTTGWKTSRMNKVDLTILRLAVYEMKWDEEVPTGVAINEAVELVKKYGADNDHQFVNGLLGAVAREQGLAPESETKPG